ncbi:hypothetical protein ACFWHT_10765 [Microbacterium sp. NPDC058342]|uniref:hypothetical protein n=1 Tax=Microbacterium sp. NPDC058342 TaxID=3346454 RepID=UPI00365A4505
MTDTATASVPAGEAEPRGVPGFSGVSQQASATMRRLLAQLSRRGAREPHVARVYDGCEDGRPWFDPGHPVIVDADERARILQLLRRGGTVLHAAAPLRDELSGEEGAVPGDLRSDGSWIWSDAAAYYLDNHWIAPDPLLIAHFANTRPVALTDDTWRRLYTAIRPDLWRGSTWPLD